MADEKTPQEILDGAVAEKEKKEQPVSTDDATGSSSTPEPSTPSDQ